VTPPEQPAPFAVRFTGVRKEFASGTSVLDAAAAEDPDDEVVDDDAEGEDEGDTLGGAVLQELSFVLEPGTVLGVAGGPGSGKTTVVRLIAGTLLPTAGQVEVPGRVSPPPETLVRLLEPERTGRANLRLLPHFLGFHGADAALDAREVFAFAGLEGLEDRTVGLLTRRDLTSLALSAVLHLRPDVLLFDPVPKAATIEVLERAGALLDRRVDEGAAVVLTGTDTGRLLRDCDVVGELRGGRFAELVRGVRRLPARTEEPAADAPDAAAPVPVAEAGTHVEVGGPVALTGLEIDLVGDRPSVRLCAEVRPERVEVVFGLIFRVDGAVRAKLASPRCVLGEGFADAVAYLGTLDGLTGPCRLQVAARVFDETGEHVVDWPAQVPVEVTHVPPGPLRTAAWRVEPVAPSEVVEGLRVAAGEAPQAHGEHQG